VETSETSSDQLFNVIQVLFSHLFKNDQLEKFLKRVITHDQLQELAKLDVLMSQVLQTRM
jgi:hypothetical protein